MDARTTWPALLNALLDGESLTAEETAWAMNEIMSGEATDVQIAGFAVAMRAKGETIAGDLGDGAGVRHQRRQVNIHPGACGLGDKGHG